jgi:hypothetical protein
MRTSLFILLVGMVSAGCSPKTSNPSFQVLLEEKTPITITTNTALDRPRFPLKCEAVGTDGPGGEFMPVMLLSSPFPRGGSETRTLGSGWPETIKIYRGTSQIAASNHFLGEFQVAGFGKDAEKSSVDVGFTLTAQQQLFLYASGERGNKQYNVRRVDASGKP